MILPLAIAATELGVLAPIILTATAQVAFLARLKPELFGMKG